MRNQVILLGALILVAGLLFAMVIPDNNTRNLKPFSQRTESNTRSHRAADEQEQARESHNTVPGSGGQSTRLEDTDKSTNDDSKTIEGFSGLVVRPGE